MSTTRTDSGVSDQPTLIPKRRLRLAIWVTYWGLIFIATHTPAAQSPRVTIRHADKVVHFAFYFGLTVLAHRYLDVTKLGVTQWRLLGFALLFSAYGAFDEWLQQFTQREMSLSDWIADVAGVAAGSLAGRLWLRRPG